MEGEEEEKKGEGNALFSPFPHPLSPLFVPATKIRYVFMKRLSKPWYTSFTFSIGPSLGKLIPPQFQTSFQRNLLTSSGIRGREISREQLPTQELLVATAFGRSDFLDSLGGQGVVMIMGWLV